MQNIQTLEHIIVDGGSTDGTIDELRLLSGQFLHVRWRTGRDQGQSHAMNIGFAYSKGDVIGYLNADDWLEEGALAAVLTCFVANPSVDIVVGNLVLAYDEDQVTLDTSSAMADLLQFLSYKWPLNPACYFYRRTVQDGIGIFPIDEEYVMDYWFLLRAFRGYRRAKTGAVLGYFRLHGANKSRVGANVKQRLHKQRQAFLSEPRSFWWRLVFICLEADEFLRARSRRLKLRLLSVFW